MGTGQQALNLIPSRTRYCRVIRAHGITTTNATALLNVTPDAVFRLAAGHTLLLDAQETHLKGGWTGH